MRLWKVGEDVATLIERSQISGGVQGTGKPM